MELIDATTLVNYDNFNTYSGHGGCCIVQPRGCPVGLGTAFIELKTFRLP